MWQDRLKEAAYTTPSGLRLKFIYEGVSKTFDKKTSAFDFPDATGTFIQDNGRTGRRFPLRLFFTGDDYDIEVATFEDGLAERGQGKLEHPVYGLIDVVPFGTITRRDDLKTAANQAVLEVAFWETINIVFPSNQVDPGPAVVSAVDEYNIAKAAEFEESIDIDSATEKATFKSTFSTVLDVSRSGLQAVADTQADIEKTFNAVYDSIDSSIDILVETPAILAAQTMILLQTPSRLIQSFDARIDAYSNLINALIGGDDGIQVPALGGGSSIQVPGLDSENSNKFQTDDIFASTLVMGVVLSGVNNQFITRSEALETADIILSLSETVVAWRDANYESLGQIDEGSAYQQFQEAIALATGFLVEISFNLKQERSIILSESRTVIDLVAELYGTIDSELDFFISSNQLTGSEILELPKGKEIIYFV